MIASHSNLWDILKNLTGLGCHRALSRLHDGSWQARPGGFSTAMQCYGKNINDNELSHLFYDHQLLWMSRLPGVQRNQAYVNLAEWLRSMIFRNSEGVSPNMVEYKHPGQFDLAFKAGANFLFLVMSSITLDIFVRYGIAFTVLTIVWLLLCVVYSSRPRWHWARHNLFMGK